MRTFDDENSGLVVVNDLAASTTEAIDSEIKRLLQVSVDILLLVLYVNCF